jgi:hypothetical protein
VTASAMRSATITPFSIALCAGIGPRTMSPITQTPGSVRLEERILDSRHHRKRESVFLVKNRWDALGPLWKSSLCQGRLCLAVPGFLVRRAIGKK